MAGSAFKVNHAEGTWQQVSSILSQKVLLSSSGKTCFGAGWGKGCVWSLCLHSGWGKVPSKGKENSITQARPLHTDSSASNQRLFRLGFKSNMVTCVLESAPLGMLVLLFIFLQKDSCSGAQVGFKLA